MYEPHRDGTKGSEKGMLQDETRNQIVSHSKTKTSRRIERRRCEFLCLPMKGKALDSVIACWQSSTSSGGIGSLTLGKSTTLSLVLLEVPKHVDVVLHRRRVVPKVREESERRIVHRLVLALERPEVVPGARVDPEQLLVRDVDVQAPCRIHLHVRVAHQCPEAVTLRELAVVDPLVRGPRVRVEVLGVDTHLVPWVPVHSIVRLDDDKDVLRNLDAVGELERVVARVAREVTDRLLRGRVRLRRRRGAEHRDRPGVRQLGVAGKGRVEDVLPGARVVERAAGERCVSAAAATMSCQSPQGISAIHKRGCVPNERELLLQR